MALLAAAAGALAAAFAGGGGARAQERPAAERPAAERPAAERPNAGLAGVLPPDEGPGLPLHGKLVDRDGWRAYKARFVTEAGRVVDTANGEISHSEGQGYAMVLAVAAGDRDAFHRIWAWTRANLMVRDDALLAWRFDPRSRPGVSDMNNATDGDLLVAWALAEAGEAWGERAYTVAARRIAVEVGRRLVVPQTAHGTIVLPGIQGFSAAEREDGPVVNLSYLVFPAFSRLHLAAPEFDWNGIARDGLKVLEKARHGAARLPTEWTSLKGRLPQPANGFPREFGYNAIRIPLYLAWAGLDDVLKGGPDPGGRALALVEVESGRITERLGEAGYGAIKALTACAYKGVAWPAELRSLRPDQNYYPATLHLMASVAVQMRYPSCARA